VLGGTVKITVVAPDQSESDDPRLNLFCFRPSVNTGWAQNNLPSRNSAGERISNPLLTFDVQYLLTAMGQSDYQQEILLAYGMQILHENPVLPRKLIRDALASPSLVSPGMPAGLMSAIAAANLAEQFEQIKIAPNFLSLEDTAHVWSALQTSYRSSMVYQVSVLLIESRKPARSTLPVRAFNVYVQPWNQPAIDDVISEDGPGTPILMTKRVALRGTNLRADNVIVKFLNTGAELTGGALTVTAERIEFSLPASARAGVVGVQVLQPIDMGTPPLAHSGFSSNVAAFVLQPLITKTGANYDVTPIAAAGSDPRRLRIGISPLVDAKQKAEVLLNRIEVPAGQPAYAYSFPAPDRPSDSPAASQLDFPIPGVAAGTYVVRVRVDGAESPLEFEAANGYVRPQVAL
jgi:hypothetical protein